MRFHPGGKSFSCLKRDFKHQEPIFLNPSARFGLHVFFPCD